MPGLKTIFRQYDRHARVQALDVILGVAFGRPAVDLIPPMRPYGKYNRGRLWDFDRSTFRQSVYAFVEGDKVRLVPSFGNCALDRKHEIKAARQTIETDGKIALRKSPIE